ncbi:hypothetical protein BS78_07G114800 [Paspalum vaginatum]|nr:hypothetical protein BS78_07G114800 [Paspalum vaginatum]
MVFMGSSAHHQEWNITATWHRFEDTYQIAARKALRTMCQIYEKELSDTPLRYFPTWQRDYTLWMARMRALEGHRQQENDPTIVYLMAYLLTMDTGYDNLVWYHQQVIAQAEQAELRV